MIDSVIAEGFEPSTACLEGRCSIQLSYATIRIPLIIHKLYVVKSTLSTKALNNFPKINFLKPFVGVAGFEPATSCSQSRRDNRATLHPDGVENQYSTERSLCRACHGATPRKNILPKFYRSS